MRTHLLSLLCAVLFLPVSAQLVTENIQTVEWYVEQILLGGGVQVSNITFNGLPASEVDVQLGYFNSENSNVGINAGMILSCGEVAGAVGPNNTGSSTFPDVGLGLPGDDDLDDLSTFGTYDAAILEFDFIPEGDALSFNYVFASEEYPEFANDVYNDVFGFFLSGPGITGPFSSPAVFPNGSINIAVLPDGITEVSINNINNGNDNTGPCENCAYYIENGQGFEEPYASDDFYIQYDGLTTVLTALAQVQCGLTYHIKIALADAGDEAYDSAVFLQEGSFETNQSIALDLAFDFPNAIGPDVVFEGCYTGTITLERFANIDEQESITVTYAGSAINGVDYALLPNQVIFLAGANTAELTLDALTDGLIEGQEDLIIQYDEIVCGIVQVAEFVFYIQDDPGPINMPFTSYSIECNEAIDIGGTADGGIGLYQYSWDTGENVNVINVSLEVTTGYTLTVTDTCAAEPFIITYLVDVPVYPDVSVQLPENITLDCLQDNLNIAPLSATGGNGVLTYAWMIDGVWVGDGRSLLWNTDQDLQIELILSDGCGTESSDLMDISVIPYEPIILSLPPNYFLNCLDTEAEVIPNVLSGGQGNYTIQWQENGTVIGAGNSVIISTLDLSNVNISVTDECAFNGIANTQVIYQEAIPISVNAGADQTLICNDPSVNITAELITGGQGPLTIGWYEDGQLIAAGTTLSSIALDENVFVLVASDGCDQIGTDSVTVTLAPYEFPITEVSAEGMGCPGERVDLEASPEQGIPPYIYLWSHDESHGKTSSDMPQVSSSYTVIVTDACGYEATASIAVHVLPVTAGFTLEQTDYYGFEAFNSSYAAPGDSLSYSWYVDGELITESVDLIMSFTNLDDHVVSLTVMNSAGCVDSAYTDTHPPSSLYVPTAFTPDGDGINDHFKVVAHDILRFELVIYNLWGEVIFQTDNVNATWNGAGFEDGDYFDQDGIYAYQIIAEGSDGRFYDLKGNLTLLR